MSKTVFNSQTVITEHISNADLRAYFVGYDFGKFRYDALVEKLMDAIVDFALGFHEGILDTYKRTQIKKAACLVYKIEPYNSVLHSAYDDEDHYFEAVYSKRGEFGELILHLLLRDFLNTQPLISKIYTKDSPSVAAHGFDSVHIGPSQKDCNKSSLFLGETKMYENGTKGINELLKDIKKHFVKDFLTSPGGEFVMISRKISSIAISDYEDSNTIEKYKKFKEEADFWLKKIDGLSEGESLQNLFDSVTIPLLCTYNSKTIQKHSDVSTDEFKQEYEAEVIKLKEILDNGLQNIRVEFADKAEPISTNLNIVLMLFPIPDKKILVKMLHDKLSFQQRS